MGELTFSEVPPVPKRDAPEAPLQEAPSVDAPAEGRFLAEAPSQPTSKSPIPGSAADPQMALPPWQRRYPVQVRPSGARGGVQAVGYSHEAMIDLILLNPGITQNELAERMGYSVGWVSQMQSSDAFQARLAEKRGENIAPIRERINKELEAMAERSLSLLQEKLSAPAEKVPDQLALRTLELSTKALGFGVRPEGPQQQVNVAVHLEEMGENLVSLLRRKREDERQREALVSIPQPTTDVSLSTNLASGQALN